jgi:hypothetical protein
MNVRERASSKDLVVSRIPALFNLRALKQLALAALMAFTVLIFGGEAAYAAGPPPSVNCTNGQTPNMTIVIYNNSKLHNIYPVLFAGAASVTDTWMQACFQLSDADLAANPYPRASEYRMYINCCAPGENGIPPGGSVTVTLPLYSPLVASINPKKAAQFVEWWQGGGINIFRDSDKIASPPNDLQAHWVADQIANAVKLKNNPPTCGAGCNLHFFIAPASIVNAEPQQLVEFSLGAVPINPQHTEPNQPAYLWVPNNVDYDVSYVNYVYMPAAMEPYANPFIGYIGSPGRISDFQTAFVKWQAAYPGWPLYNDGKGNVLPDKIPSALEIFANTAGFNNTDNFIPEPATSAPVMTMAREWKQCVNNGSLGIGLLKKGARDSICPQIQDVSALIEADYANYKAVGDLDGDEWKTVWGCGSNKPIQRTDELILAHAYAWTPFLEGCTSTTANQLYHTNATDPNDPTMMLQYTAVKAEFDQLQYSLDVLKGKYGTFDPYVALIHGPDYLNAPYTYAYSVDDAVGNMQADGTGLVIAVSGLENLPYPDHATPNVNFNFGYSSSYDGGINFTEYGRCTATPDTPTVSYFASFPVPEGIQNTTSSIVNCTNTMADSKGRLYQFRIKAWPSDSSPGAGDGFPGVVNPTPAQLAAANSKFIDCTGNTGQVLNWCHVIYPYQATDPNDPRATVNYFVILQGPPPLE